MKKTLLAIILALFSLSIVAQADDLSDRKATMKTLGGYLKILNGQKASYDGATVAKEAANAVAAFEKLQTLFKEKGTGETKATDNIWSDSAGFSNALKTSLMAAKAVQANGESGDEAGFAAAFGQLGQSCGGCHRNYRSR